MTWHELPELPKPDTEVLAEVETSMTTNFEKHTYFQVLECTGKLWWQWDINTNELSKIETPTARVKRWAYIEEEKL